MAVKWLIRIKCHALILPVDHVSARAVSPQLDSALRIEGGILKERVIDPLELAESVGVIEPADRRHQMESLAEAVRDFRPFFRQLCQFDQISCQCVHIAISCSQCYGLCSCSRYFLSVMTAVFVSAAFGSDFSTSEY